MKSDVIITMHQFKKEIHQFQRFSLRPSSPMEPLSISATFYFAAVNVSPPRYVAFRNQDAAVCLGHIQAIHKETIGEVCVYSFTCQDYSQEGCLILKDYQLECC